VGQGGDSGRGLDGTDAGRVSNGLAQLFDRYHRPLFGFFLRLTGQWHLSEDLVQEVFLRVFRYGRSFREGGRFKPWFYQIARRVYLDQVGPRIEEMGLDLDSLPTLLEDPVARVERDQNRQWLERTLASLPLEKRELLLLSRDPDLSYADLANLYGCSVGALKVRVHRALLDLRTAFLARSGGTP